MVRLPSYQDIRQDKRPAVVHCGLAQPLEDAIAPRRASSKVRNMPESVAFAGRTRLRESSAEIESSLQSAASGRIPVSAGRPAAAAIRLVPRVPLIAQPGRAGRRLPGPVTQVKPNLRSPEIRYRGLRRKKFVVVGEVVFDGILAFVTSGHKEHLARMQGLEKVWDDHLGLFSVEGIALAKCLAEQCFLRVGSPREGRHNPGQHDHEGRPAAEGECFARGEQYQA
jgi:hypothetical protein